jgi:hypothetical protein
MEFFFLQNLANLGPVSLKSPWNRAKSYFSGPNLAKIRQQKKHLQNW